jgi:hypothetical protein
MLKIIKMEYIKAGKEMRMGTMTDEEVHKIFSQRHSRLITRLKPQPVDNKNPFKLVTQSLQFKSKHILDE